MGLVRRGGAAQTPPMRPFPTSATAQSARQFGVISRRQLLQHLPERQVDLAVENGHLEIVQWGVYRIPGSPRTPEQAAMAAVLRTRSGRVGGPFVLGLYGRRASPRRPSPSPCSCAPVAW
jgi:hypothetical protein